jgi:hypothetical protein
MPVQTFVANNVLTASQLNSLVNLLNYPVARSTNLNPCVAGNFYYCTASITMTLPTPTIGQMIGFKLRAASGTITINRAAADVIFGPGFDSAGVTTIALTAPESFVILVSDGTNWHVVAISGFPVSDGAIVATSQTTTSTSYADLTTTGPAVTVTTATKAIVTLFAQNNNNTAGQYCCMGFALSGATTAAAADTRSMQFVAYAINAGGKTSASWMHEGLTPGSNTATAKYRVTGGTGTWLDREIYVLPLAA